MHLSTILNRVEVKLNVYCFVSRDIHVSLLLQTFILLIVICDMLIPASTQGLLWKV